MSDQIPDFEGFFKRFDEASREWFAEDGKDALFTMYENRTGKDIRIAFKETPAKNENVLILMGIVAAGFDAIYFGFAMDSWVTPNGKDTPPSENPERKEAVVLMAYEGYGIPAGINVYLVTRPEQNQRSLALWGEAVDDLREGGSVWGHTVLPQKPKSIEDVVKRLAMAVGAHGILSSCGFPWDDALAGVVMRPTSIMLKAAPEMLEALRKNIIVIGGEVGGGDEKE